jgi:hypothetical protein
MAHALLLASRKTAERTEQINRGEWMDLGLEAQEWTEESVLPVSVILDRAATGPARVMGIVVGQRFASQDPRCLRMRSGPEGDIHMWLGFSLRLRRTQADDYALNVNSPNPVAFVIASADAEHGLRPIGVTVSLDEAQNLDGTELRGIDESVHRVAMPPEVFRWVERFVLEHYVPRQRKGRGKKRSKALFDAEVGDWSGEEA